MVQIQKHKEGNRTVDAIAWALAWNRKSMRVRTDSCLGARTGEVGGQWVCGKRTGKEGISKRSSWCDSGLQW